MTHNNEHERSTNASDESEDIPTLTVGRLDRHERSSTRFIDTNRAVHRWVDRLPQYTHFETVTEQECSHSECDSGEEEEEEDDLAPTPATGSHVTTYHGDILVTRADDSTEV